MPKTAQLIYDLEELKAAIIAKAGEKWLVATGEEWRRRHANFVLDRSLSPEDSEAREIARDLELVLRAALSFYSRSYLSRLRSTGVRRPNRNSRVAGMRVPTPATKLMKLIEEHVLDWVFGERADEEFIAIILSGMKGSESFRETQVPLFSRLTAIHSHWNPAIRKLNSRNPELDKRVRIVASRKLIWKHFCTDGKEKVSTLTAMSLLIGNFPAIDLRELRDEGYSVKEVIRMEDNVIRAALSNRLAVEHAQTGNSDPPST